jgi:hypothetical protein
MRSMAAGIGLAVALTSVALAQTAEQVKQTDRVVALTKPLFDCVKKKAHSQELYSSPERPDIVAIAAVGSCSREEGAYKAALFQLQILMPDFDANSRAERTHQQLIERAITTIVLERKRQQISN